MNHQQIHELFKQSYNRANWKQFLGETFANARLLPSPEILTGIDSNVASEALKLGYVIINEDGIERQIAIYEVKLAQGIILERNRVGLRNVLRRFWKDIDAAFIVYHQPDSSKWRFSYVSELTGYNAEGEFIKIRTEPKRYTYVLGEGESTRTASERFSIVASKSSKATLDDVKEAFSVEKLSKAFFDEYKIHYDIFCDFMVAKPSIRQSIFDGDEKSIRDFNKKLLGRIVFLYFIQKKGWLGVPVKGEWGKGDFNFLTKQFEHFRNKELFYTEFLSTLFFDTLNSKREDDVIELVKGEPCRIPYLNGGLFEEDDKKHRNLILPAELFQNLFGFFNQYNFTIYEDDPNDHTVAVDPEMLSHIFENLLEDNKDKGAFYTPKEIVHYMCHESLIEYLCSNYDLSELNNGLRLEIEIFIKKNMLTGRLANMQAVHKLNILLDKLKSCDPAIGSGAFPMGLLHEIFSAKQVLYLFEHGNLSGFNPSDVKLNIIQNSIYGVDIEKGAVDIARLRFWLTLIVDEPTPKPLPNLDYKIVVGNSLVSKLGDDIIDIEWNINETVHGLFGQELAIQKNQLLKELVQKQREFFSTQNDKKKLAAEIRNLKIDLLINQLQLMIEKQNIPIEPKEANYQNKPKTKFVEDFNKYLQCLGWQKQITSLKKLKEQPEMSLNFFDWKLDFPEVMNDQVAEKVGFDIVIANPPYLGEKGNKDKFREIKQGFLKEFYQSKMDIFYFFFHLGMLFAKKDGIITFITTNYYPTADGAIKLRKQFKNEVNLIQLINFNEFKVFDSALGQHNLITILKNTQNKIPTKLSIVKRKNQTGSDILGNILSGVDEETDYLSKTDIFEGENNYLRISSSRKSNNQSTDVFDSILNNSTRLDSIVNINSGCDIAISKITDKHLKAFPHLNIERNQGVFVLNAHEMVELQPYLNEIETSLIKTFIKNSNIEKYIYHCSLDYLLYLRWDINPKEIPTFFKYLSKFRAILEDQAVRYEEPSWPWFTLHRPREQEIFDSKIKILIPYRSKENRFAISTEPIYSSRDVFFITNNGKTELSLYSLAAILNSNLIYHWLFNKGKRKGDTLELYSTPLSEIPVSRRLIKYQDKFDRQAKQIIQVKKEGKKSKGLEQEIDNLVYKLYELTYDEVKIIDPKFELTEAEYEAIKLD